MISTSLHSSDIAFIGSTHVGFDWVELIDKWEKVKPWQLLTDYERETRRKGKGVLYGLNATKSNQRTERRLCSLDSTLRTGSRDLFEEGMHESMQSSYFRTWT